MDSEKVYVYLKYGVHLLTVILLVPYVTYFFSRRLDKLQSQTEIRNQFIEQRIDLEKRYVRDLTRIQIAAKQLSQTHACQHNPLSKELTHLINQLQQDNANLSLFFGAQIGGQSDDLASWLRKQQAQCWRSEHKNSTKIKQKVQLLLAEMQNKLYPKQIIGKIR